jgi:trans-AT polyketide synthase/acyltransferase/oxidoreductase domain-containing protein/rhizoxin biosynthesis acyltransferase
MIAFLFPGQCSQKRGMGQRLFEEAREYTSLEKDVVGVLGYSMRKLCLEHGTIASGTRNTLSLLFTL